MSVAELKMLPKYCHHKCNSGVGKTTKGCEFEALDAETLDHVIIGIEWMPEGQYNMLQPSPILSLNIHRRRWRRSPLVSHPYTPAADSHHLLT